jgi:hypothetical protein
MRPVHAALQLPIVTRRVVRHPAQHPILPPRLRQQHAQAPFREMPAIVQIEFDARGHIGVAKKQPAFVLLDPPSKASP